MDPVIGIVGGAAIAIAGQRLDAGLKRRRDRRIGEWVLYTELSRAHGGFASALESGDLDELVTDPLVDAWREHRGAFASLPFKDAIAIYDAVATSERARRFARSDIALPDQADKAIAEAEQLLVDAIEILRPRVAGKRDHRHRSSK